MSWLDRRRTPMVWGGILGALLLLGGAAATAVAHAYLAESSPRNGEQLSQSPAEVVATFSQEVAAETSSIAVFTESGEQVDNGDGGLDLFDPDHKTMMATLPQNLPPGKYVVEWVVLSAEDGDTTEGAFVFGVATEVEAAASLGESRDADGGGTAWGWWLGGGAAAAFVGLLAAILLLTRQPMQSSEPTG